MFTPEKMEQIHVVFSEKDSDRVIDVVLKQGSLQLVDAADMELWAQHLSKAGDEEETAAMRTRRERIEDLLKHLSLLPQTKEIQSIEKPWDEIDQKIADIEQVLNDYLDQRGKLETELERLNELKNRVGSVPFMKIPLKSSETYSYLTVEVGHLTEKNLENLRQNLSSILHILSPIGRFGDMVTIMVIVLKQDEAKLYSALREAGFQTIEVEDEDQQLSPEIFQEMDTKIVQIQKDLTGIEDKIKKLASDHGSFLQSVHYRIRFINMKRQMMKFFRKTDRTVLISGWLPQDERDPFIGEIRQATRNQCIIEEIPAEAIPMVREGKLHVPVKLKNPSIFKPFELITSAYGIPAYQTMDPTPILGISFLLMFGMMFGDVGHGLVLALVGALLALKGKPGNQRNAGMLIFYGGCASIVFGLLFGSIFGMEDLLPTIWIKPMESIDRLFKVAIFFGIGMVFMAIGINVINGIKKRDFLGLLFDKAGLLAAILYWCGIIVATRMITTEAETRGKIPLIVTILMLASVALLFLKEPIVHLIQGKRKLFPEGVATGIMGGIVEILEIFLGFLANTVSFIRVAAFGLAHAGLFMAIFALSDAVKNMAAGLVSLLVLIFGNILIILLEGLVVSIQAVRLEFYEFFSRFFVQSDVVYRPLSAELKGN
ncbi:hypothetical protein JW824_05370 [bacterium]|nr:hypothetical protein [bacterium]RQV96306.1 MAG: hypothetical protein EH221_04875 [bacterium]